MSLLCGHICVYVCVVLLFTVRLKHLREGGTFSHALVQLSIQRQTWTQGDNTTKEMLHRFYDLQFSHILKIPRVSSVGFY